MKSPKDILANNDEVPQCEKISTQIWLNYQKDRVIINQDSRVSAVTRLIKSYMQKVSKVPDRRSV